MECFEQEGNMSAKEGTHKLGRGGGGGGGWGLEVPGIQDKKKLRQGREERREEGGREEEPAGAKNCRWSGVSR